ncbi:hypothetical protein DFP72DRAFT_961391 [Ephemerocybe angulata]|uniref:DUF6589 domain-containing protein n=1 Tax=Ephemerocybe angulata TaxID=980116 RepID=A0A8H6I5H8_9AGAR|nr:hypothetical protein DFP72DRAFT_961391 [Tulosesus angulatus]
MHGRWRVSAVPPSPLASPHPSNAASSSSPFLFAEPPSSRKRAINDENQPPGVPATPTPAPKKRKVLVEKSLHRIPNFNMPESDIPLPSRHHKEKLAYILPHIQECGWTLGDFLYYLFLNDGSRGPTHASMVSQFLSGRTIRTPAEIIALWDIHPDGCLHDDEEKEELMYRFDDIPYIKIKPVRSALSSFAAQKIQKKVKAEAKTAVKPENGLHASARKKSSHKLAWKAMGLTTVEGVQNLLQEHLPVTYQLVCDVTGDTDSDVSAKRRPGPLVATHALSSLLYKRSSEARLLPLSLGLLAFAYSTPVDVMAYCSRVGIMPTYNTVTQSLRLMANHQALAIQEHGRDTTKTGFIVLDNVQNYHRPRDPRMGSGNRMNIGLAATYCEVSGINPAALSLEDKRRHVSKNLRSKLDLEQLLMFIDVGHLNTIFSLHWLRALVNNIPQLSHLKPVVSKLFRSRAQKVCIPPGATPVYPLSSSGKCETVTTELKEAMHDFLAQIGQTEGDYLDRILMVGGDGLTFQRLLEVQRYLQLHKDNLESLAVVEPVLALWHTEWTFCSSVFENFWDTTLSADPSTLGHSSTVIGRAPQANLKKVDYYPAVDLLYLVLDTRMLDCWRLQFKESDGVTPCVDIFKHFADLAAAKSVPGIEELEKIAQHLHRTYTSTRAIYEALDDTTKKSRWTASVPCGSAWIPKAANPTSQSEKATPTPDTNGRHPNGDRVLANSIALMRDTVLAREMSYAIAEGDAGRVYEVMKMILFHFAGSTHTKYCSYLLEVVTRFELESSAELVEAILRTTLVNLSGLPGSCTAADIMQEYFNRLLEAIVEKKGIDYGDSFAREVISPNLGHFAQLKLNLRSGIGLAKRSGKHTAPHENPEIRKLLHSHREHELHLRRPGRVFSDTDRDEFTRGITKLRAGRLKKWVHDTTGQRHLGEVADPPENNDELSNEDGITGLETLGLTEVRDGELVMETFSNDTLFNAFDDYMGINTDELDDSDDEMSL